MMKTWGFKSQRGFRYGLRFQNLGKQQGCDGVYDSKQCIIHRILKGFNGADRVIRMGSCRD